MCTKLEGDELSAILPFISIKYFKTQKFGALLFLFYILSAAQREDWCLQINVHIRCYASQFTECSKTASLLRAECLSLRLFTVTLTHHGYKILPCSLSNHINSK